jgi:hypothetical protein
MAEDRPVSTVNSEFATPPPSLPALDNAPLDAPRASFFGGPSPSIGPIGESSPRDSRAESAIGPENDQDGLTPGQSTAFAPLEPPRASFLSGPGPSIGSIGASSLRDSRAEGGTSPENEKEGLTPGQSTTFLAAGKDSEAPLSEPALKSRPFYRRPILLAIGLGAIVAVALAVALPLVFTKKSKPSQSGVGGNQPDSGSGNGTGPGNGPTPPPSNAVTGGDGSTVVSGNTSFVYSNRFGGYCEFLITSVLLRMWAPDGRHIMFRLSWELSTSCAYAFRVAPGF